jgi:hypothetical protein
MHEVIIVKSIKYTKKKYGMTYAFRSAPAQKRRPAPVTTATLDRQKALSVYQLKVLMKIERAAVKWHCVIAGFSKIPPR